MTSAVGFQSLQSAYASFLTGNTQEGSSHFQQAARASSNAEGGVYGKMWELKNKPTGDDFGRTYFNGSASPQEKAAAIAAYMISQGVQPTALSTLTTTTIQIIELTDERGTAKADAEEACAALQMSAAAAFVSSVVASSIFCPGGPIPEGAITHF